MKSLWIYMFVILVSVKCVASQCVGNGTCDCHCYIKCYIPYSCTYCAVGWSGTASNRCQRQNVAYNAEATSTSTSGNFFARNAVDENLSTYALTYQGENPQLTLKLSDIFNIKNMFLRAHPYQDSYYDVFVTNSVSNVLSDVNKCKRIVVYQGQEFKGNVDCSRILTGDQIVVQFASTSAALLIYEVAVYQCSQGTYGYLCGSVCRNCKDNRCDGYTGVCESGCNIGWQGQKCDTKCNSDCLDNKCNQTGFCTVGCSAGWFGDTCSWRCPSKCETSCDRNLGCTSCQAGYNGPYCYQCNGNNYGKNCSFTCQNCQDCDNVEGCKECLDSFYGNLCELKCPNQCKYGKCYRLLGTCTDGCNERYTGTKCDTPCKDNCATCETDNLCISCVIWMFGSNCEYVCPETCGGSKTCNKNSGVCSECNPGKFGPNCTQQCSSNCITGIPSVCNRNGTCIRGCLDGWFGPQCDTLCPIENCEKCNLLSPSVFFCEICNIGYYLDNEQGIRKCVKCPSRCVSCESDSICTQCIPNFTGNLCENECNIHCVDGLCELDGTCTYGCNNSRHGVGCEVDCRENCKHCFTGNNCTKCLPGYWGKYCTGMCSQNCFNCTSTFKCEICKPGFYGYWCNYNCDPRCLTCDSGDSCTSCRDGWSGRLCQCSKNCKNEGCDGDGICQSGCNGSYYGERCDVFCPLKNCQRCDQMSGNCTECSNGLYGINCTDQCSRSCLGTTCNMTDACLRGCEDGFDGKECTEIRFIPVYGRFRPNGSQDLQRKRYLNFRRKSILWYLIQESKQIINPKT